MKNKMTISVFAVLAICVAATGIFARGDSKKRAPIVREDISSLLEEVRKEFDLPAIAAAVVRTDGTVAAGASGLRITGKPSRILVTDRIHTGSVTKPMTAAMAAALVEKGKISWNTTLADVFPEWKDQIHPSLRTITLEQLLSHRAGIQPFEEDEEIDTLPKFTGDPTAIRRSLAEWLLRRGAASPVGEHVYSNAGYGLAAAMAERITGKSWETLMQELLFEPLGMKSAGFGWAARTHPDEPWGHRRGDSGFIPHSPNDDYKLTPLIAPAGDIHVSIIDLARFAQANLGGLNRQASFLTTSTFEKLHEPIGDYSLGWNVVQIRGLPASTHSGSAGTFYAGIMVYPKKDIAVVIAINASGKGVDEARNKLFNLLLRKYKAIE